MNDIILYGPNAFYNKRDYYGETRKELDRLEPPKEPSYRCTIEPKVWRVAKKIFSFIVFPIALFDLWHVVLGKFLLIRAASPLVVGSTSEHALKLRKNVSLSTQWKIKRIAVEVDGYTVDAAIVGRAETLGNGRWVLAANGIEGFYEKQLKNHNFKKILRETGANGLVFNYPGVGSSSGWPSRSGMIKAYQAMVEFLEKGIGANVIISEGYSMGGGVQSAVYSNHTFKDGIQYLMIKNRTYCDLSSAVYHFFGTIAGVVLFFMGWNICSEKFSKKTKVPEIILQTANVDQAKEISTVTAIKHDGIVHANAAYAKPFLAWEKDQNRRILGIPEQHADYLKASTVEKLTETIKEILKLPIVVADDSVIRS